MTDKLKLKLWQDRLNSNATAYEDKFTRMKTREKLYSGQQREMRAITEMEVKHKTEHLRNITSELIEAQVDSSIPAPKVTARRAEDEGKAKLIEDMLRNELDRLPMELINDQLSRTIPIQGGAAMLVEWDNTKRTHTTIGELDVSMLHPLWLVPQDGVYDSIESMDYIILKLPQTKGAIKHKYGIDVASETEAEPDIKGGTESTANDMITQYIAYYRNEKGGIGLYSWVGDIQLEDIDDYQARRLRRCARCGAVEPAEAETIDQLRPDGNLSPIGEMEMSGELPAKKHRRGDACPYCGGTKWENANEEFEELAAPIQLSNGEMIPDVREESIVTDVIGLDGMPMTETVTVREKIPYYKPDIYPVILFRNVSIFGQLLGDSDVDKIEDQQNTTNRLSTKIIDKLLGAGSYITLPDDATIEVSTRDVKVIRPGSAANKQLIDVYDLEGNVSQDMAYLSEVYEEARQQIGITDSFQGRRDTTATSGKAKEFAAAQTAGRLESKRVMRDAAFAQLFEAMFKFKLAYTDEPRPVLSNDANGDTVYEEFNRYDFLEKDDAGEWYWNDQFLFSCDTSAPLASNREAMWQEARLNLQTGAFGDPTAIQTLILFWSRMEQLHYPGAADTKTYLENQLQQQMMAQQMQQMMQQQMMMQQSQAQQAVIEKAQADAARDALNNTREGGMRNEGQGLRR